jgi:hypothetical protein
MKQRRTTIESAAAPKAPARAATTRSKAKSRHAADAEVPVRDDAAPVTGQVAASRTLDPSERERLVAMAAYFRAEKRGFAAGGEVEDWLEAEKEVARHLSS